MCRAVRDEVRAGQPPERRGASSCQPDPVRRKTTGGPHTRGSALSSHADPASLLKVVEEFFCLLGRPALGGPNGRTGTMADLIELFIPRPSQTAKLFVGRKREVKGDQPGNTALNSGN